MSDFQLMSGEFVIFQREDAVFEQGDPKTIKELFLTNERIVCIGSKRIGLFKSGEVIQALPLSRINILDGQIQAKCGKCASCDDPVLELYFKDGKRSFIFKGGDLFYGKQKKEIVQWIEAISHVLLSTPMQVKDDRDSMALPGAAAVADALRGTVDVFKKAFSMASGQHAREVTCKCPNCGTPMAGYEGQKQLCRYCGTPIAF